MSPLGIVTCTVELPSDAEADGETRTRHIGVVGRQNAKPHEIEKAEVGNVVGQEITLVEVNRLRAVRILRRIDALKIAMAAPISIGGVCPIGQTRSQGIGRQLPAGCAGGIVVLPGDVCGRHQPGDDRRDRRRGLTELLLPALRGRRSYPHNMISGRLDLLIGGAVGQACHPCEQDPESLLIELLAATKVVRSRGADPADGRVARE